MRFSMTRAPHAQKFLVFFAILGLVMLALVALHRSKALEGCSEILEAVGLLLTVILAAASGWEAIKDSRFVQSTQRTTLFLGALAIALSGPFAIWWFQLRWFWAIILPIILCLAVVVVIGFFSDEDLSE
jgi:hypothetical protein